jgi:hypothetical protein
MRSTRVILRCAALILLAATAAFAQAASAVSISAATQSGSYTTYTYTLTNGPDLQAGERIAIRGMSDAVNNGTFTITAPRQRNVHRV